jgi:hypothetical protein
VSYSETWAKKKWSLNGGGLLIEVEMYGIATLGAFLNRGGGGTKWFLNRGVRSHCITHAEPEEALFLVLPHQTKAWQVRSKS